ncbi:hypothetical protein GUITHDRAFT_99731 [Guillardia theta CCMP2712]|uniref:Bifunctional lysine-specific demethylase and histidyl-hydroxylase n=1 Tax=Guillardia theta (strain CCMP2712) TaxID=905079 RepID=L1K3Z9_GUITC|nr:hypothetical protein GUITHDRAFT_99731 [Guillardia theta CCMP2712]EKX55098.1 hypothetical protein GUITHDRAFT_99731 [Guillardia theta CCMP2712]|eukprot:XP_005842078.1 hypothetical protein GUITHDRAFT_99731 [Guillardia theta CCMP2712]
MAERVEAAMASMGRLMEKRKRIRATNSKAVEPKGKPVKLKRVKREENGEKVEQGGHKADFLAVSSLATLHDSDSRRIADKLFELLISPTSLEEFYSSYHEQRPLLIKRNNPAYYDQWMNLKDLELLVKEGLEWNFEIDATRYTNGQRTTHNGEGWTSNCHTELPLKLMYGANMRMVALFGFQGLTGDLIICARRPYIYVYEPRNEYEAMPRYSSRNMTEAKSSRDTHSLHVTVSHGYRNSWYDVIKETLISALDVAVQHNVDMRRQIKLAASGYDISTEGNPDDDVEELLAPAREAEAEKVSLKTQFRLLEGDIAVLVHSVDNSRDFHGKEEQGIEFDVDYADALNAIIRSYPAYTRVKDVAHLEDDEDKLALVKVLVQNGVALTLPAKK